MAVENAEAKPAAQPSDAPASSPSPVAPSGVPPAADPPAPVSDATTQPPSSKEEKGKPEGVTALLAEVGGEETEQEGELAVPEGLDPVGFREAAKAAKIDAKQADQAGALVKAWEARKAQTWREAVKAKAGWQADVRHAKAAIAQFAPPEVAARLMAQDHPPEVLAFFAAVGRLSASPAGGEPPPKAKPEPPPQKDPYAAMYPSMNTKKTK